MLGSAVETVGSRKPNKGILDRSMNKNFYPDRRYFIAKFLTTAFLPLTVSVRGAQASEQDLVNEQSDTAKALSYVHDASTLSKDVRADGAQTCAICIFYTQSNVSSGPCALFAGQAVSAEGWCKAWVVRS